MMMIRYNNLNNTKQYDIYTIARAAKRRIENERIKSANNGRWYDAKIVVYVYRDVH